MARGRESFEKRARELKRQERATLKRERREDRSATEADDAPAVDEEALMLKYGQLSERREAGEIDEETFERERVAIFVELGLVPAAD